MSSRTFYCGIAVAAAFAAPLAHAASDGFKWIGGEAGVVFEPVPNTLTRSDVKRELEVARRDGTLLLQQRERNYTPPTTPVAGFTSSREEARQAARLIEQRQNDGWRYIEGEPGWTYVGR
ncbi:DUF4148 domain-containing protein [Piscinibacter defluvii]|uniref:DUF4148 domain-containing protein n=1 Tax=Piscinibacter defluvii TaxID=1796922 RepID=UPI000FDF1CE1|nr:DUF4148 domain-containing protein [Piscinibacter defluvii]